MENKNTFYFKSNIVIKKDPVDLIPEVGDQFIVCDTKETAVLAALKMYTGDDATDIYYTDEDKNGGIFCKPLVFGDKKFAFVGLKNKTVPSAASEAVTSRVFYIYEME